MATKLTLNPHWNIFELCKGAVCLDIGANEGGMAQAMLNSGAIRVICIEAGAVHCDVMRKRFQDNSKVQIIETGVSDIPGVLKNVTWLNAWVLGNPAEINLPVSPGACDIEGYKLVDINLETVDNLLKDKTESIGFMKIDVDGYDYKVLLGSVNTINTHRPVIFIELSYYYNIIPGSSVEGFFKFVRDHKYIFISLDGYVRTEEFIRDAFPFHSSCDVFLCPEEKLELFSERIRSDDL